MVCHGTTSFLIINIISKSNVSLKLIQFFVHSLNKIITFFQQSACYFSTSPLNNTSTFLSSVLQYTEIVLWGKLNDCINIRPIRLQILVGKPKERRQLRKPRRRWGDHIKINHREMRTEVVDPTGSRYGSVRGCCEYGNELLGFGLTEPFYLLSK